MLYKKLYQKTGSLVFCLSLCLTNFAFPPINLFRPSDRPLIPNLWPRMCSQITVGYEGSLRVCGFQFHDDEFSQYSSDRLDKQKRCVNVLQIYQDSQDAIAAFKGFPACNALGQLSQLFNINDDNGNFGIYEPTACFKVPVNLMFAARYQLNPFVGFGLFLPYYTMELSNVRWRSKNTHATLESRLENNLIDTVQNLAGLDLCSWKRSGIGDLLVQARWMADFPQMKPLLTNVRAQTRLGLSFPTGKKQDENKVLAIPFGNDGSWGVQVSGGLDLTFRWCFRGGIDVEFLYLFGNTKCRRVKTDCAQTDLLLLIKVPAFKEFGLSQQYNIYLEAFNICRGFSLKANYQYLKRNDDKLFVCSDTIDPFVVNTAESLQEWTAHSLVFSAHYDCAYDFRTSRFKPAISAWFKWGFNGKRALLANTLGATITFSY